VRISDRLVPVAEGAEQEVVRLLAPLDLPDGALVELPVDVIVLRELREAVLLPVPSRVRFFEVFRECAGDRAARHLRCGVAIVEDFVAFADQHTTELQNFLGKGAARIRWRRDRVRDTEDMKAQGATLQREPPL
jgi:hypothetical protein